MATLAQDKHLALSSHHRHQQDYLTPWQWSAGETVTNASVQTQYLTKLQHSTARSEPTYTVRLTGTRAPNGLPCKRNSVIGSRIEAWNQRKSRRSVLIGMYRSSKTTKPNATQWQCYIARWTQTSSCFFGLESGSGAVALSARRHIKRHGTARIQERFKDTIWKATCQASQTSMRRRRRRLAHERRLDASPPPTTLAIMGALACN